MVDPEGIVYGPGVGIPVVTMHDDDDDCWHCRLLRKKAALATVGFEAGLVEFDWSKGRSIRLEVDHADHFLIGSSFMDRQRRLYEVFAREGNVLRAVPRP